MRIRTRRHISQRVCVGTHAHTNATRTSTRISTRIRISILTSLSLSSNARIRIITCVTVKV